MKLGPGIAARCRYYPPTAEQPIGFVPLLENRDSLRRARFHQLRTDVSRLGRCYGSLSIVLRDRAEKGGLLANLRAVANEDNLRVRGIEMTARGGDNVVSGERTNSFAICFEITFRHLIEIDGRKLTEQA